MGLVDDVNYDDAQIYYLEELFHYIPKLWPAYLFIALFGAGTIATFIQNVYYKSNFMYIMVFAGCLEVIGYYTRILSVQQTDVNPYIVSELFLLLSPIFIALINYIVVGKLMGVAGIDWFCIKSESLFKVFLTSDIVCLFVQGGGGGILGGAKSNQTQIHLGEDVILAGLAIQLFFFTIFNQICYNIAFGKPRMWDNEKLKLPFICLGISNIMLYLRNFYRVVQFGSGTSGYIVEHEWLFYLFESTAMLCCFIIYNVLHYDRILPEEEFAKIEEANSAKVIPVDVPVDKLPKNGKSNKEYEMVSHQATRDEELPV